MRIAIQANLRQFSELGSTGNSRGLVGAVSLHSPPASFWMFWNLIPTVLLCAESGPLWGGRDGVSNATDKASESRRQ